MLEYTPCLDTDLHIEMHLDPVKPWNIELLTVKESQSAQIPIYIVSCHVPGIQKSLIKTSPNEQQKCLFC